MYLKDRVIERKGEPEKKNLLFSGLHPKGSQQAGLCRAKGRSLEFLLELTCKCRSWRTWTILHCFPRCMNVELDQKWNSQGSNQHSYTVTASQTKAESSMPQGWPQHIFSRFLVQLLQKHCGNSPKLKIGFLHNPIISLVGIYTK